MKGHKAHHHRHPRAEHAKGGKAESPKSGHFAKDAAPSEVYAGKGSNVEKEAKERKHGGKAKKHVGLAGHKGKMHAGRTPRKSGGKVGADSHPLSSAHKGTEPKGHKSYEPED